MLTMYDSANAETIPPDATVAAGYVDGYGSYPDICRKVPHATHMSIAVNADHDADCLDVEPGHATPSQIPGWWKRQRDRGVARPVIYANTSDMKEWEGGTDGVLATLKQAGIARSSVRLWSAHYTDHAHICGPDSCGKMTIAADGTQFTKHAHGLILDQSLLRDDFFAQPTAYLCQGQKSLDGLSQQLHCTVSTILQLTAEHSPEKKYYERMADYLNGVFAADTVKVPEGINVYHPELFHSHGTQTLQGLANAFGCKPADIVQYTAENSPGAEFGADMAKYLDDVFSNSDTHVPAGIHLYYEK
jgi:hypothetical protein